MGLGVWRPIPRVNEVARHPEVDQESKTAFKSNNQILAATIQCGHAFTRQLGSHLCRLHRASQARVENLDRLESAAEQPWLEGRTNGLDFGQFGHGRLSLAPVVHAAAISRMPPQSVTTPRRTLRSAGRSLSSPYAASTSCAASSARLLSRAWISASVSPCSTPSPRFLRQTIPTAWSIS